MAEASDPALGSPRQASVAPVAATSCDVDPVPLAGHGPIEPPFDLGIGHACVAEIVSIAQGVQRGAAVSDNLADA